MFVRNPRHNRLFPEHFNLYLASCERSHQRDAKSGGIDEQRERSRDIRAPVFIPRGPGNAARGRSAIAEAKGIAKDKELAPYLEGAANAGSVRGGRQ
jgi:hypothetical protein